MEKKQILLNSIEDLVTLITTSGEYTNSLKWELGEFNHSDTIDPQTGDVYYRVDYNEESEDPWFHKSGDDNLHKRQSELVYFPCWTFHLHPQGDHRHQSIQLSQWLGHELDKIWPRNPNYKSLRMNRGFTLMGLAKRLGVAKGLEKQLKDQFASAKAAEEKRVRNANRNYACIKLDKFMRGEETFSTDTLKDIGKYIPEPELSALKKALQDAIAATIKTIES